MSGGDAHGTGSAGDAHGAGSAGDAHGTGSAGATPAGAEPVALAPGVLQIDTLLGGWDRVTAGYLIQGPNPVLIETGSQSSVPVLLDALGRLGLGANDLAGVVVTHIHLDHAGGVGNVAEAFPNATVYVHEKGARHLVDPSRLVDSASRVYGPLLDSLYGRLDPTPAERVKVLADLEEIEVGGGRALVTVDSPGHAKHHLALHDSASGILFVGDAVGVRLPDAGVLRPSTPPPDFDLETAVHSLHRFADRRPAGLALAHYGLVPDHESVLEEAEGILRQWAEVAEAAFRAGEDIAEALESRFAGELAAVAPEHREKLETLNGVHSNAAGFRRWLETRDRPLEG
ncbi:MAG TPA: MBL fold metallo-hydrolase [Acidimicrobiales bacterium]|nr:MBL fold metallo-hydrolase [Acidimicrobiales bacterium]